MAQLAAERRYLLHIGTEKTGSSFLQTQAARNRQALKVQGTWFPKGTRYDERCMARGEVSAGNGRALAEHIAADDWARVERWVRESARHASRSECQTILVSSEWLLPALAQDRGLERLLQLLSEQGFANAEILLVLRDPAEQFISLYKHRARRGTAGTIDEWGQKGYALPDQLSGLREQIGDFRVNLRVHRYTQAPGALQRIFFEDWLAVKLPTDDQSGTVNPSLSLSELVLLRQLASSRPELVVDLSDRLLRIPRREKTQGAALEDFSRAVAAQTVAMHMDEWEQWNAILPEGEKLELPSLGTKIPEPPRALELSEAQLAILMRLLAESSRLRFRARLLWRDKLRPIFGLIKRLLFAPFAWIPGNT